MGVIVVSGNVLWIIVFLPFFLPSLLSVYFLSPPLTPPPSLLPSPPSNRAMYQVSCRAPRRETKFWCVQHVFKSLQQRSVNQSVSPLTPPHVIIIRLAHITYEQVHTIFKADPFHLTIVHLRTPSAVETCILSPYCIHTYIHTACISLYTQVIRMCVDVLHAACGTKRLVLLILSHS